MKYIDNLTDLARYLNKSKKDITKQDIFDHVDEYIDFWLTAKEPWVILDGGYSLADLKLILEFAELNAPHEQSE